MVAEANYGGRVTDTWDRRTIITILKDFYTPKILKEGYTFSASGVYKVPPEGNIQDYILYIKEELPRNDLTEVFGMHENASMTSAINESSSLLGTCLSLLPRSAGGAGKS
jgi:dynein heavy chain